jgi:hypothetical protein
VTRDEKAKAKWTFWLASAPGSVATARISDQQKLPLNFGGSCSFSKSDNPQRFLWLRGLEWLPPFRMTTLATSLVVSGMKIIIWQTHSSPKPNKMLKSID